MIKLLLLSIASISATSAWTTSPSLLRSAHALKSSSSLSVGQGWDNDDFLNSLSADPNERERVTEDYYAQSRFGKDLVNMPPPPDEIPLDGGTKGAVITEEMKQRIKEQNQQDESQGGTMFKSLMARAQQRQSQGFLDTPNNMPSGMTMQPYQPQSMQPTPPQAAANPYSAASISPDALAGLSVEQQAELFRRMIAGNQQSTTTPPTISLRLVTADDSAARNTPSTDGRSSVGLFLYMVMAPSSTTMRLFTLLVVAASPAPCPMV